MQATPSSFSAPPALGSEGAGEADATRTANNAAATGEKGKKAEKRSKRASSTTVKKTSAVLEWNDIMVRDLMTLRYETYAERFSKAKNNAGLKETWLLLATELIHNQKMPMSSEQFKNKVYIATIYCSFHFIANRILSCITCAAGEVTEAKMD